MLNPIRKSFLFFTIFLLFSCNLRKDLVYFQSEIAESSQGNYTPMLKKDDLLSITVSASDPETAIPFNLQIEKPSQNNNSGYVQGNPERIGYLIDENGNINFPTLGLIKVDGLKRTEVISLLEEKLKKYIKNPIVNLQILNYKITILGDVKSPGTFKIPNERITILEAIGLAGDMTITGTRKNVMVIRDRNGKKEQFRINLTDSKEVFSSPAYYLEQNDVVYVEPNATARTNSSIWKTSASIFVSTAAVIISMINVLTN